MLIKTVLRDDHKKFTWADLRQYLIEYADCMNEEYFDDREDHTPEGITCYVADNIVYSNAPHVIRMSTKQEVDNDFRQAVALEIELMLDKAVAYKTENV